MSSHAIRWPQANVNDEQRRDIVTYPFVSEWPISDGLTNNLRNIAQKNPVFCLWICLCVFCIIILNKQMFNGILPRPLWSFVSFQRFKHKIAQAHYFLISHIIEPRTREPSIDTGIMHSRTCLLKYSPLITKLVNELWSIIKYYALVSTNIPLIRGHFHTGTINYNCLNLRDDKLSVWKYICVTVWFYIWILRFPCRNQFEKCNNSLFSNYEHNNRAFTDHTRVQLAINASCQGFICTRKIE